MRARFHSLCLWLSAADTSILATLPEGEAIRFVGAGGAVLTTTFMAWLAGSFAAHGLLHLGLIVSILFGAAWALAIVNLERYIQSSIRRQSTPGWTVLSSLPRLGLAILLGLVITPFLMLVVFQTEVHQQVTVQKNEKLANARAALNRQYTVVPQLKGQIAELETAVDTPPQVGRALQMSPGYHTLAKNYGRFLSESRNAADPGTAHRYAHAAQATLAEMGPLRSQLLAEEAEGNTARRVQQRIQLKQARQQLAPLQAQLDEKQAELERRYRERPGLADQLEGLSALTGKNETVSWESTVLLLFIMTIDVIPALLKTLMCLGRKSAYEVASDEADAATIREVKANETLRASEAERSADEQRRVQDAVGQARVEGQIAAQTEWDETTMETLRETLRPHLQEWAQATAQQYAEELKRDIELQSSAARSDAAAPGSRSRPAGPAFTRRRPRGPRNRRR
jgi:Domain of unknown function (DUF4407)